MEQGSTKPKSPNTTGNATKFRTLISPMVLADAALR